MSSEAENVNDPHGQNDVDYDNDPECYAESSEQSTTPNYSSHKPYYPITEQWHRIDEEIISFLQGNEIYPTAIWDRVYYGFPNINTHDVNTPIKLWISSPAITVWKQKLLIKGVNEILNGYKATFSGVEVEVVGEYQAHLLTNPPKVPGKLLKADAFANDIYMGESFGLKGDRSSATIGGEILIKINGSKTSSCRFVSAFHPFMDVVSERFQTKAFTHDGFKPGQFPIVIPSQSDAMTTSYSVESQLKTLIANREQMMLELEEGERLDPTQDNIELDLKKYLGNITSCDRDAGYLWTHGKFKPQSDQISMSTREPKNKPVHNKDKKVMQRPSLASSASWYDKKASQLSSQQPIINKQVRKAVKLDQNLETMLDWCLIVPGDDRVMFNQFPDSDSARVKRLTKNQFDPPTQTVKHWSTKNIEPGKHVIKRGRTTGITVGKLIKFETITIGGTKFDVWEIEAVQTGSELVFLQPGDSGSWAVDMEGNWIGLLTAGASDGSGYMLPVDSVVREIERKCCCTVISPAKLAGW